MSSYRVLSGASANSLEEQVIDLMKDGYVCQGGVAVGVENKVGQRSLVGGGIISHTDVIFSQAMIKVSEQKTTTLSRSGEEVKMLDQTVHWVDLSDDGLDLNIAHMLCDTEDSDCLFIQYIKADGEKNTLGLTTGIEYQIIGKDGVYTIDDQHEQHKEEK